MIKRIGLGCALLLLPAALLAQDPANSLSIPALERRADELRQSGMQEEAERVNRALGEAHNTRGLEHWQSARYDSAAVHFGRARDIWVEVADQHWLGRVYNNLGATHYQWGNYEPALDSFLRSLAIRRELDDRRGMALVLTNVGRTYHDWQQYSRARIALEEAIDGARATGQRDIVVDALADLSAAHEAQGNHRVALERLRAYNELRDSIFNQGAVQRLAAMEAQAEADRQLWENARLQNERGAREAVIARQRTVGALGSALLLVSLILTGTLVHYNRAGRARGREMDQTNQELRVALSEVRTLEGLIPICMHCKKVRDDDGFWEAVESYISNRSDARFSHGICAECGPRHYGEDWPRPHTEGAGTGVDPAE